MWIDAAKICDSEKLTEWNFGISYILNPIVVFFTAMETPKNFLQLIYRYVIFLRPLKGCKTAITRNCADWVCAENNDEGTTLP
jgi:hypothetical protein